MQSINSQCGFLVLSALSPKRKVLRIRVKILENRIWEMAVISACTLHNSATRQANCNHMPWAKDMEEFENGMVCVYHCIKNLKRLHHTTRQLPRTVHKFRQKRTHRYFLSISCGTITLPFFSLKTPTHFNT